jgi:lysophospholipase L1-like esterase
MKHLLLYLLCLLAPLQGQAQTSHFDFDMTQPQPCYTDATGYGYDITASPVKGGNAPFFFSVKVPDGNYRVSVTIGSRSHAAVTTVRAENRRLMVEPTATRRREQQTVTFVVNKRSPRIDDRLSVRIKDRERDYLHWDDRLTLEFNGTQPAVSRIVIDPDTTATTVFLCGNSTVVDQSREPWASWGQMIPRWWDDQVAVCNLAESGLTAGSFLAQGRLDYITAHMRPGDYVFCEFGHNDQKERSAGAGAWYNFSYNLKVFIDRVRQKGGTVVFCTPTQRRAFDKDRQHIVETHGDYPDAMRAVARREGVPVIELHDMTRTFFETLGYEGSTQALVHYPANTFPGQTQPLADNTHFNPYGAYEVAKMVVMGIKQLALPLTAHLRQQWTDFDPAKPDNPKDFVWYAAPIYETAKPDGN